MSGDEQRLLAVAGLAFALFLAIGVSVSHTIARSLDLAGGQFRGASVRAAAFLTWTGRSIPLALFSALAFVVYALARLPLWVPVLIIVSQVLSQGVVELFKRLFRRVRPDDWLLRHEAGFSYPSGHSSTAVTFFGAWSLVVLHASMPGAIKVVAVVALMLWMAGIAWSRLALAAHYITDVAGGLLFGSAWLCAVYVATSFARAHRIL